MTTDTPTGAPLGAPELSDEAKTSLRETGAAFVRQIERGIGDRESLWFGRNDLLEEARTNARVAAVRAGMDPDVPRPSPEEIAEAMHERAFSTTTPSNLTALVDDRVAALAERGAETVARAVADLRTELGPAYDRLVADAKAAFPLGTEAPAALFGDRAALEITAARGRFELARRNTSPTKRN